MSRRMITLSFISAAYVVLATSSGAFAQFGLFGGNRCCNPCGQPVVQNVYRTVPVTEYRQVQEKPLLCPGIHKRAKHQLVPGLDEE